MVTNTELKRITGEANRRAKYNKYVSNIEELTTKATGKKGVISFYKNCTFYSRSWQGSHITWPHYYCDSEPKKLFDYFTKGRLRLLEKYMPNYYEFINKYYLICIKLLNETYNMYGHDSFSETSKLRIKEGQHYYNGWLQCAIDTLTKSLVLFRDENTKYLHKMFLVKEKFNRDIANHIQSFLTTEYTYI
jgi:hypothetical protein